MLPGYRNNPHGASQRIYISEFTEFTFRISPFEAALCYGAMHFGTLADGTRPPFEVIGSAMTPRRIHHGCGSATEILPQAEEFVVKCRGCYW